MYASTHCWLGEEILNNLRAPPTPPTKAGGGYIMILDKPPKQKTQKTSGLTLYNYRLKIIIKEFNRKGLKNYVI